MSKVLWLVNKKFSKALDFNTNRFNNQSQECEGQISGKIAICAERMNIKMISASLNPSIIISVLASSKSSFESFWL